MALLKHIPKQLANLSKTIIIQSVGQMSLSSPVKKDEVA